jgi:uncharacterized glyoxalase superfamily protein PhnB
VARPCAAACAITVEHGSERADISLVTLGVDDLERAGARIVKPARSTFYGGYAGYFRDLDGHLWEVAYNPGFASLG